MGIFSGGPQTFVSSVIYNLAGDVNKRPNYLKSTVLGNVIGDSGRSMGDSLSYAYLHGPGMQLRSFSRWAEGSSGYSDAIGLNAGQIITGNSLDADVLATQIPHDAAYTVSLQATALGIADCTWWADQYMLDNHPEKFDSDWHADYLNGQVVITYIDGTTESFTPAGFDITARYLFATYKLITGRTAAAVVAGNPVSPGSGEAFPDTTGWTEDSSSVIPTPVTLNTTVVSVSSYSDNRASDTTTTVTPQDTVYAETHGVYEKTVFKGIDPLNRSRTWSLRSIMTQDQTGSVVAGTPSVHVTTDTIEGGVTKTTTTTTTVEAVQFNRTYRVDTQDITNNTFSGLKVFIYPFGSGNPVLDAMFNAPVNMGTFFPYIPVRIDNRFISSTYQPNIYTLAKKAYKKAVSGKFDKLVDQLSDNPSLGDIDFAYVVFGVSLNVAEVKCKQYIYTFFKSVMASQSFDATAYADWKVKWEAAKASQDAYAAWLTANWGTGLDNVATMPDVLPYPPMPQQSVRIVTSQPSNMNFHMQISWNGVLETTGAGMKSPDHPVGDMWFEIEPAETFEQGYPLVGDTEVQMPVDTKTVTKVVLYSQVDANNWTALTLYGLTHENMIYGGKSVYISAVEALNDKEESGFIIPLHEGIYKETPLVAGTQMATACAYLVLNCYQVVKKKWYQTGIFTVIMIIIIIIITIVTWGQGTGPAATAYAAIGTAVGFTGTAAIVAGMAITMIASVLIMKVLSLIAKKIFGDKIGAIVAAVAMVVLTVVGADLVNGGNWSAALMSLTQPENLLQLTSAVGNGIAEYTQVEVQDIVKETQDMLSQYNTQMKQVSDLYAQNIGTNQGIIDPMMLTDSTVGSLRQYVPEPPDVFLNRTLMTGSDVAELSSTLISQYTSLTLDLDQNLAT